MPTQKPKRATVRDVAQAAGVSPQTVSRVVNASPRVTEATRGRVLQAMNELDYVPNWAAQMLNTQRSHTIEVITADTEDSVFRSTTTHIASSTLAYGYQVVFSAVTPMGIATAFKQAAAHFIDGILLVGPTEDVQIPDADLVAWSGGIPFVQLNAPVGAGIPSVIYDQERGAALVTQHLIELGHRQIAAITGALNGHIAKARHAAWVRTLREHGLEPGPIASRPFNVQSGYDGMIELLATGAPFTAVFAGNDRMALGAIHALHEHGLRVSDDISLVGFDNIEHAPHFIPPLTTVYIDFHKQAELAVEYLVSIIEKPDTPVHQRVLIPELIVRSSTRRIE